MNSAFHLTTSTTASRWPAQLSLRFRRSARGCRLVENRHRGPLAVQRAFYPEGGDLAHVYLLHPPGGLVSGDRLDVRLTLEEESQVLCTTPGAGRFYGARADRTLQEQYNHLALAAGASLEWFPQETIVYPGAHARMDTQVRLARGAHFAGWDLAVLGLPASAQPFTTGKLQQRFLLSVDEIPVLSECLRLDMSEPALFYGKAGLQGLPVSGFFIAGPFTEESLSSLPYEELRTATNTSRDAQCRIGRLDRFLVGRYLGRCAQEARRCFLAWWALLRPLLLQRPLCLPAIWST